MKAIRVQSPGGQDVLKYEEVPDPRPNPGQALVKLHAVAHGVLRDQRRGDELRHVLPRLVSQVVLARLAVDRSRQQSRFIDQPAQGGFVKIAFDGSTESDGR